MGTTKIETLPDADALAARAADIVAEAASEAIAARGRFTIALSGGSTPEKLYKALAAPDRAGRIDWSRTLVFVGDERLVPYDDARSNYGLARRTLLDHIAIPAENLYPIPTDGDGDACARAYEQTLRTVLRASGDTPPAIDLILLGLGDDGHTASLFPGNPSIQEIERWTVSTPPGVLPPPVDRVTVTFPVINAARQDLFLVAGAGKAQAVKDVLEGDFPVEERPSRGVQPHDGVVTWLLDEAAAAQLTTKSS